MTSLPLRRKHLAVLGTFFLLVVAACSSKRMVFSEAEKTALEEMVNNRSFRLTAQWANPLATQGINALVSSGLLQPGSSPNRIDIIGTTAYLNVKGDSVTAQLPYYGERQFSNTYNPTNVGIQFDGIARDVELVYDEKKEVYDFSFYILNDLGEGFNVNGTLFPNLKTTFYINSTQRFTIGYTGLVGNEEL